MKQWSSLTPIKGFKFVILPKEYIEITIKEFLWDKINEKTTKKKQKPVKKAKRKGRQGIARLV
jgi:hypothetical protein